MAVHLGPGPGSQMVVGDLGDDLVAGRAPGAAEEEGEQARATNELRPDMLDASGGWRDGQPIDFLSVSRFDGPAPCSSPVGDAGTFIAVAVMPMRVSRR